MFTRTVLFLLVSLSSAQESEHYSNLLDTHRRPLSLSIPIRHPALDQSALDFAYELAERGELSHRDRFQRGPEHRASTLGLGLAGEVLGYGLQPFEVFEAWLKSPGHRRVLEHPGWKYFGIGIAPLAHAHVVVILFWAPP